MVATTVCKGLGGAGSVYQSIRRCTICVNADDQWRRTAGWSSRTEKGRTSRRTRRSAALVKLKKVVHVHEMKNSWPNLAS